MTDELLLFIKKNPKLPWDWKYLSCNPGITSKDIKDNPDFPWDSDGLSRNPNFNSDFIKENTSNWDFYIKCNKFKKI
ncbi:MAG TPA: hypothetical protein V6C58_05700 [Allocoleopsis sp.]